MANQLLFKVLVLNCILTIGSASEIKYSVTDDGAFAHCGYIYTKYLSFCSATLNTSNDDHYVIYIQRIQNTEMKIDIPILQSIVFNLPTGAMKVGGYKADLVVLPELSLNNTNFKLVVPMLWNSLKSRVNIQGSMISGCPTRVKALE